MITYTHKFNISVAYSINQLKTTPIALPKLITNSTALVRSAIKCVKVHLKIYSIFVLKAP